MPDFSTPCTAIESAKLRGSGAVLEPSGRFQETVGNEVSHVAFKEANSPRRKHKGSRMCDVDIEIRFASTHEVLVVDGTNCVLKSGRERGKGRLRLLTAAFEIEITVPLRKLTKPAARCHEIGRYDPA